jgi:hypothetical protein
MALFGDLRNRKLTGRMLPRTPASCGKRAGSATFRRYFWGAGSRQRGLGAADDQFRPFQFMRATNSS